jgi:histidyl-tRNA synthetase
MFETLPGFREFYPESYQARKALFDSWRCSLEACGFLEYEGSVLEPLELYIEKSGQEIVEQLFHFEDKGGRRVALRPEMTPTLARMVGTERRMPCENR